MNRVDQMLPYGTLPVLATDARRAGEYGVCAVCGGRYVPDSRIATLPGGGAAHVGCVAKTADGGAR